ncbi:hypothetical protein K6R05_12155 [Pantoea alfalfae]|uniref:hypothetical protein n=1 Tax=Pantoea alfalfae TaxID=3074822 RepID=UPI001CA468FC|nr:hypothetical protein [Pantoea alfalfae]QZX94520.1 hypothetical protein K6R05_12155 [Pantoea alfalfae]
MMNKQYAVIKTGSFLVENTIAAPLGFEVKGCYLIEIGEGKTTQPGAFYNPNDGFFYGDDNYKTDFREFRII